MTIKTIIESKLNNIHTTLVCKVISYNAIKRTASVQPLYRQTNIETGEQYNLPQIVEVPAIKQRFKSKEKVYSLNGGILSSQEVDVEKEYILELKQNDLVVVIFSEKSIDDVMAGEIHAPRSKRSFDLSDGIIIAIL